MKSVFYERQHSYAPGYNGWAYTNPNSTYQAPYTAVAYTDPIPLPDSLVGFLPKFAYLLYPKIFISECELFPQKKLKFSKWFHLFSFKMISFEFEGPREATGEGGGVNASRIKFFCKTGLCPKFKPQYQNPVRRWWRHQPTA
jgi:hypothetical protein